MSSKSPSSKSSSSKRKSKSPSSLTKKRSILKKNGTKKGNRKVRIHSPKNQIHTYNLGSDETRMKMASPIADAPDCGKGIFPCSYRDVIFENADEWNEYVENAHSRNRSTGYKSKSAHRREIMKRLSKTGKSAKRIPEEWRLYDVHTGEIHDMRDLDPKSLSYKPLK